MEEKIVYFEKKGPDNTEETVRLAVQAAKALGIPHLVVTSTTGRTPMLLSDADIEGLNVTVVSSVWSPKGENPLTPEMRKTLQARGFNVVTAAHALSGVERSMSTSFSGAYPIEIMAHTLRMLGAGTKVCVEVALMAADAGCIPVGQPAVVIAGSGAGADTALVLRPATSADALKTRIDRYICKPINF